MPAPKKLFQYTKSGINEDLALRMAHYCVRNTIIEDYHTAGKISDPEMMAFNKEVVNKIYSFLELISNPDLKEECAIAFRGYTPIFHRPKQWDLPKFEPGLKKAIERRLEREQSDKSEKEKME